MIQGSRAGVVRVKLLIEIKLMVSEPGRGETVAMAAKRVRIENRWRVLEKQCLSGAVV